VLFEMLAGRLPFQGKGPCATLAMALTLTPPRIRDLVPECPEAIDDIVSRALAKDPADRFESPLEMANALAAAARELEVPRGATAWIDADARDPIATLIAASDATPSRVLPRPAKRPAARAKPRAPVRIEDRAMRALDDSLEYDRELSGNTMRLDRRAQRSSPVAARIALALLGIGLATALGLRLSSTELLTELAQGADIDAVQTHIVPARPPARD
jgi:serine/threonine-protein kinase